MESPTGKRHARRDVSERFWAKVKRSTPDACWEWNAPLTTYGWRSHRVAYQLVKGNIPDGVIVMHSCDNRACCNPAHLVLGTQRDNMADMKAKRRSSNGDTVGSRNGAAKINEDDARAILAMASTRRFTQQRIGELFGIDQTTVSLIVRRKKWQHVE